MSTISASAPQSGSAHSPAGQIQLEREILRHIKEALRITLRWDTHSVGLDHKLATVRFTARSFRSHVERIMDLEESDGYLEFVAQFKPHLYARATHLREDHAHFREAIERLIPLMDHLQPHNSMHLDELCRELLELLARIDHHDLLEADLIQEALCDDEGGEG